MHPSADGSMKDGNGWRGGGGPGKAVHGSSLCLAQTAKLCAPWRAHGRHAHLIFAKEVPFAQSKLLCSLETHKITGSLINQCDPFS